jgi:hypothetical protein
MQRQGKNGGEASRALLTQCPLESLNIRQWKGPRRDRGGQTDALADSRGTILPSRPTMRDGLEHTENPKTSRALTSLRQHGNLTPASNERLA